MESWTVHRGTADDPTEQRTSQGAYVASLRLVIGLTGLGDRLDAGIGDRLRRNAQVRVAKAQMCPRNLSNSAHFKRCLHVPHPSRTCRVDNHDKL